jgi:hypothetical protein
MKFILFLSTMLVSTLSYAYEPPVGAIDTKVTQNNLATTVCVPGYSSKVRPPVSYTNRLKYKLARPTGVDPTAYELDHYVPLAVGGHPTSLNNLWLEDWPNARKKDVLETRTHRDLCAGKITLVDAQKIFISGLWKKMVK